MKLTRTPGPGTTKDTISWDRVPEAVGFKFTIDGKTSHTWDATKTSTTVAKAADRILVEALGVKDSGLLPEPTPEPEPEPEPEPGTVVSPLGYLNNRASTGFFPPTHVEDYSVVATYPPTPAAFTGTHLIYRSAIACQNGFNNISEPVCLSKGWALHAPDGSIQRFEPQGGVIGNPADRAYQLAWCNETLAKLQALRVNGFWCDNVHPNITAVTKGVYPQEFPNDAAYRTALLSWATYVYDFFNSRGYKCAYNTGVVLDDKALLAAQWWPQIGPHSHYLTEEHWIYVGGFLRKSLPAASSTWHDWWDGHRALHNVAIQSGSKFLPLAVLGGDQVKRYGLGTFMLDWTGDSGAAMWSDGITTNDPWTPFYGQAVALGAPTGAAVKVGNVWQRKFEGGTLEVDPVTTTDAKITLG